MKFTQRINKQLIIQWQYGASSCCHFSLISEEKRMAQRGEIYYADLSPVIGSEQGGLRPVLIVQNNVGNKYSPTVVIAAITAKIDKGKMPTHVEVKTEDGLERNSVVLLEQLRTIDKQRLKDKITQLNKHRMKEVDQALQISVGLSDKYRYI